MTHHATVQAFSRAAEKVPAYVAILAERGVKAQEVAGLESFVERVPVIDKAQMFGRFELAQLCVDGDIGNPASVLTSSGHSGRFAFGLYNPEDAGRQADAVDDALDLFFGARSRSTLLINALPMGVKVPTRICTLAETSVRPDMVTALVKAFAAHYRQVVIVAETAFLKCAVELGVKQGIDWRSLTVHAVVGEEPLAENARSYLAGLLGIEADGSRDGSILSSMGVAELGLNLFFELPALVKLRGAAHRDAALRELLFGESTRATPMIFAYDPSRIFVETLDDGALVVTTLDLERRIPLIRYRTGDHATPAAETRLVEALSRIGLTREALMGLPVVFMWGRGEGASAGGRTVHPENVKEGIYADAELAGLTTANFRLATDAEGATVRVQLVEGVEPDEALDRRFAEAITRYVEVPVEVRCEAYATFGDGMALDFERKFDYLQP